MRVEFVGEASSADTVCVLALLTAYWGMCEGDGVEWWMDR